MAILTILEAFVGKLIGKEIEAWLPKAAPCLLRYAVSKMPTNEQERYLEEWAYELNNIPGEISKVLYAVGLVQAAWGISSSTRHHKGTKESAKTSAAYRLEILQFTRAVEADLLERQFKILQVRILETSAQLARLLTRQR
jgi:hypothetical protein